MPHTIAENLTRLQNARTDIATAITAKGGTVNSGDGLEEFPADIATIPSGSQDVVEKDVNFFDYDGTIVYSYTATEFANLTEMPANPTHEGLTAQGWNWTLSDAKTYVQNYGMLDIGQEFVSSDATEIVFYVPFNNYKLELTLSGQYPADSVTVNWGDNSSNVYNVGSGNTYAEHEFLNYGTYTIKVHNTNNLNISRIYNTTSSPQGFVYSNVISIICNSNTFVNLSSYYSCKTLILNTRYTSISIGSFISLEYFCVPKSVTNISSCNNLKSCKKICFSNTLLLTSAMSDIHARRLTLPNGITNLTYAAFSNSYLEDIVIPNTVTTIDRNCFSSCLFLRNIKLPNSVTSLDSNTFYNNVILSSVVLSNSLISIPNDCFYDCKVLRNITIPSSVTSIGNNAFRGCDELKEISIPSSVTTIGSNAFLTYSLRTIYIDKPTDSITGAPWGATNATVIWNDT